MALFGKAPRPRISDPAFGTLTLGPSGWSGDAPWLDGQHILVSVERGDAGPLDEDRTAFLDLTSNYRALAPGLQQALFALWTPGLGQPLWEESWTTTPEALWQMLELSSVAIRSNGKIELLFAFAGEVWPDAMFNVEVSGSQVRPLSLDD